MINSSKNFIKIITNSPEETFLLGSKLGKVVPRSCFVSLNGDTGNGKTTFIKGLADSLEINPNDILSPYFNILFQYEKDSKIVMWHFDFMRINKIEELHELNISEILDDDGIVVAEWGNKFKEIIPEGSFVIEIDDIEPTKRSISISCSNENLMKSLAGVLSE